MLVGGDRKRLEAALVDVAHAGRAVMGVPALRVGDGEPAEEFGDLLVLPLPRPDDEVPMVAHQRVAEDSQRNSLVGFFDHPLEGGEVGRLFEQPQPAIGSIEHMVRITTHDGSSTARHADDPTASGPSRQEK